MSVAIPGLVFTLGSESLMRRILLALLFVLAGSTACFAETPAAPKPTSASAPAPHLPRGVVEERDIAYVPEGDPAQKLDLYLPQHTPDHALPLIVWIHGGGWAAGSKSGCPAVGFVPRGYVVVSVEYRFSQKAVFPAQIQDCQAVIRWLRANHEKYHIDADHVGVWGASAGGHLVALLGTSGGQHAFAPVGGNDDESDRVQAVCDFFGPADFNTVVAQAEADKTKNVLHFNHGDPYSQLIGVPLNSDQAKGDAVSPVHYVSKDAPPYLILHGTADPLVPFAQSTELADALKKDGVDVILQPMPGAGHGGPAFNRPAVRNLIERFFDKHLKGADVTVEALPDSAVTEKGGH
jgi:acetyl esterase/lipase